MNSLRSIRSLLPVMLKHVRFTTQIGNLGSGACKRYYSIGTIRQAGGAFAKAEVAKEEEYFYKKQQEQLRKLRSGSQTEGTRSEDQTKSQHDAADTDKQRPADMDKK